MTLRELTAEKHKQAERMLFTQKMVKGSITLKEYLHYLLQLSAIIQILEQKGIVPDSLKRLQEVFDDIEELLPEVDTSLPSLQSTKEYGIYLQALSPEESMAHVYVHYLALAYGGQILRPNLPGQGRIYQFKDLQQGVGYIRSLQTNDWSEEANKGFEYTIQILGELERLHSATE